MSRRVRPRYGANAVEAHIRRHHPGCPGALREHFVVAISEREWAGVSLGKAFGIVSSNYVRHRMTDYEQLLRQTTLTRDEARLVVAREVQDILDGWKTPPERPEPNEEDRWISE